MAPESMMSRAELKRQEGLAKILKSVVDVRLKLKSRIRSLLAFLELSTEIDNAEVFRRNDQPIFQLICTSINHRIRKIRERKSVVASKDFTALIELLNLFLKFIYCSSVGGIICLKNPDTLRIVEVLLTGTNHSKLRRIGFNILIQIIQRQDSINPDLLNLFSVAIPIKDLESADVPDFESSIGQDLLDCFTIYRAKSDEYTQSLLLNSSSGSGIDISSIHVPTLLPLGVVIPKESDCSKIFLFEDLLCEIARTANVISQGITANPRVIEDDQDRNFKDVNLILDSEQLYPLVKIFNILKTQYLTCLFPAISNALGLVTQNTNCVKSGCPKELLLLWLKFIVMGSACDEEKAQSSSNITGEKLLRMILYSSLENREFVFESLRQGLAMQIPDLPMIAMHYYLKDQFQAPVIDYMSNNDSPNTIIRRFLDYYQGSILFQQSIQERDMIFIQELALFYKFIAMEIFHQLDSVSWNHLMQSLLLIQESLYNTKNQDPLVYKVFNELFANTVWACCLRIPYQPEFGHWKKVEISIIKLGHPPAMIDVWTKLLNFFTLKISELVFDVDSSIIQTDIFSRKKNIRIKNAVHTHHVNNKLDTNVDDKSLNELVLLEKTSLLTPIEQMKRCTKLFIDPSNLNIDDQCMLVWKSLICGIGKIDLIKDPETHFKVIKTISQIIDTLHKLRRVQSYTNTNIPNLFDIAGIVFKASQMGIEFVRSSAIACGSICRIMLQKNDQHVDIGWYTLFYKIIIGHLIEYDELISHDILNNCIRLYTLCLPGATLTIPSVIEHCQIISLRDDLPELVVNSIISIVGSLISYENLYIDPDHKLPGDVRSQSSGIAVFKNLRIQIKDILQTLVAVQIRLNRFGCCSNILWNISLLLLEENKIQISTQPLQQELLSILLENIAVKNHEVCNAAADGLSLMADTYERKYYNQESLVVIIGGIILSISEHLSTCDKTPQRRADSKLTIPRLYRCLLEWLMIAPPNVFSNPNISLRISELIEETIHISTAGIESGHVDELESADNTFMHLSNYIENYNPSIIDSTISSMGPQTEFISVNNRTIISFTNLNDYVKVVVRNAAGNFTWEMEQFYHSIEPHDPHPNPTRKFRSSLDSMAKGTDLLDRALQKIQTDYPECIYNNQVVDLDLVNLEEYRDKEINCPDLPSIDPMPPKASNSTDNVRLLLGQLGHLSFDHLKEGNLHILTQSPALLRDLRGLDQKSPREVAKFALIYVCAGQEDEFSIYRNCAGSIEYDEFVLCLGWEVDLNTHLGYRGGLEVNMLENGLATYYSNSMLEIIFHDITKFPTDSTDPKQLKKKRHVGNDHVHIIWNEHYRDYRFDTIGGDFGNAQIVVTPMANNLYAIDLYRDPSILQFGPLQCQSIVSKQCLGACVRMTAMNAHRASQAADVNTYEQPYTARLRDIETIIERHRVLNDTFETFMCNIMRNHQTIPAPAGI